MAFNHYDGAAFSDDDEDLELQRVMAISMLESEQEQELAMAAMVLPAVNNSREAPMEIDVDGDIDNAVKVSSGKINIIISDDEDSEAGNDATPHLALAPPSSPVRMAEALPFTPHVTISQVADYASIYSLESKSNIPSLKELPLSVPPHGSHAGEVPTLPSEAYNFNWLARMNMQTPEALLKGCEQVIGLAVDNTVIKLQDFGSAIGGYSKVGLASLLAYVVFGPPCDSGRALLCAIIRQRYPSVWRGLFSEAAVLTRNGGYAANVNSIYQCSDDEAEVGAVLASCIKCMNGIETLAASHEEKCVQSIFNARYASWSGNAAAVNFVRMSTHVWHYASHLFCAIFTEVTWDDNPALVAREQWAESYTWRRFYGDDERSGNSDNLEWFRQWEQSKSKKSQLSQPPLSASSLVLLDVPIPPPLSACDPPAMYLDTFLTVKCPIFHRNTFVLAMYTDLLEFLRGQGGKVFSVADIPDSWLALSNFPEFKISMQPLLNDSEEQGGAEGRGSSAFRLQAPMKQGDRIAIRLTFRGAVSSQFARQMTVQNNTCSFSRLAVILDSLGLSCSRQRAADLSALQVQVWKPDGHRNYDRSCYYPGRARPFPLANAAFVLDDYQQQAVCDAIFHEMNAYGAQTSMMYRAPIPPPSSSSSASLVQQQEVTMRFILEKPSDCMGYAYMDDEVALQDFFHAYLHEGPTGSGKTAVHHHVALIMKAQHAEWCATKYWAPRRMTDADSVAAVNPFIEYTHERFETIGRLPILPPLDPGARGEESSSSLNKPDLPLPTSPKRLKLCSEEKEKSEKGQQQLVPPPPTFTPEYFRFHKEPINPPPLVRPPPSRCPSSVVIEKIKKSSSGKEEEEEEPKQQKKQWHAVSHEFDAYSKRRDNCRQLAATLAPMDKFPRTWKGILSAVVREATGLDGDVLSVVGGYLGGDVDYTHADKYVLPIAMRAYEFPIVRAHPEILHKYPDFSLDTFEEFRRVLPHDSSVMVPTAYTCNAVLAKQVVTAFRRMSRGKLDVLYIANMEDLRKWLRPIPPQLPPVNKQEEDDEKCAAPAVSAEVAESRYESSVVEYYSRLKTRCKLSVAGRSHNYPVRSQCKFYKVKGPPKSRKVPGAEAGADAAANPPPLSSSFSAPPAPPAVPLPDVAARQFQVQQLLPPPCIDAPEEEEEVFKAPMAPPAAPVKSGGKKRPRKSTPFKAKPLPVNGNKSYTDWVVRPTRVPDVVVFNIRLLGLVEAFGMLRALFFLVLVVDEMDQTNRNSGFATNLTLLRARMRTCITATPEMDRVMRFLFPMLARSSDIQKNACTYRISKDALFNEHKVVDIEPTIYRVHACPWVDPVSSPLMHRVYSLAVRIHNHDFCSSIERDLVYKRLATLTKGITLRKLRQHYLNQLESTLERLDAEQRADEAGRDVVDGRAEKRAAAMEHVYPAAEHNALGLDEFIEERRKREAASSFSINKKKRPRLDANDDYDISSAASAAHDDEAKEEETLLECPMCMEDKSLSRFVQTECLHVSCRECAATILSMIDEVLPRCPMCRMPTNLLSLTMPRIDNVAISIGGGNDMASQLPPPSVQQQSEECSAPSFPVAHSPEDLVMCHSKMNVVLVNLQATRDEMFAASSSSPDDDVVDKEEEKEKEKKEKKKGGKKRGRGGESYTAPVPPKLRCDVDYVQEIVFVDSRASIAIYDEGLSRAKIPHTSIGTLQQTFKDKSLALDTYQTDPSQQVLLAMQSEAASGLDLSNASILHKVDPADKAGRDVQQDGRILRKGQTKQTIINTYVVPNTADEFMWHQARCKRITMTSSEALTHIIRMYEESMRSTPQVDQQMRVLAGNMNHTLLGDANNDAGPFTFDSASRILSRAVFAGKAACAWRLEACGWLVPTTNSFGFAGNVNYPATISKNDLLAN